MTRRSIVRTARRLLGRLAREEGGGEVFEYAIVAGLISVAAIALMGAVGRKVFARWDVVNGGL